LHFGFDGKLYVSVGDGGVEANAQRLKSLSGKILRLNPDGSIPPDNPFAGQIKPRPEIFAFGFRNPWRMALRPSTRSYFAGDVGSATWEELDRIKPGRNYGWPHFEGPCLQGILCKPSKTDFQGTIPPVFYYPHQNPPDAYNAVIAGAFADHSNYPPPYRGGLFMADLVGWVRVLTFDSHDKLTGDLSFDMVDSPVDFQRGPDGSIYVVSFWSGIIYRYVYAPPVEAARRPTSGNGTGQ
jgi:glucose/arabinose dehydrogenase